MSGRFLDGLAECRAEVEADIIRLRRLAREYPEEFGRLVDQHLERQGLLAVPAALVDATCTFVMATLVRTAQRRLEELQDRIGGAITYINWGSPRHVKMYLEHAVDAAEQLVAALAGLSTEGDDEEPDGQDG